MTLIYVALVVQFNSVIKPLLVFAAVPYGMVGAFGGLWIMGSSFGFIAMLGMIALMGVIVSHVIVLFDFIEERREEGEDLKTALLDAGILRLRPVMITVGATILALIPLAIEGGPLWQPLSYAQIGGLIVAMVVTLVWCRCSMQSSFSTSRLSPGTCPSLRASQSLNLREPD